VSNFQLAATLRTGTRALHSATERTGIMQDLLRGRIDLPTYARLLRNLLAIYTALERALNDRHIQQPLLKALHFPELRRQWRIKADLEFLCGDNWVANIPLTKAAGEYASRLEELEEEDPVLLLAHSYVRYLGDLSGGQVLRGVVGKALRLTEDAGLQFYSFSPLTAPDLAARYRLALDSIQVDTSTGTRIVAEAQSAFGRHINLFGELAAPQSFQ